MSIHELGPDFQPFGIDELFTPDDWIVPARSQIPGNSFFYHRLPPEGMPLVLKYGFFGHLQQGTLDDHIDINTKMRPDIIKGEVILAFDIPSTMVERVPDGAWFQRGFGPSRDLKVAELDPDFLREARDLHIADPKTSEMFLRKVDSLEMSAKKGGVGVIPSRNIAWRESLRGTVIYNTGNRGAAADEINSQGPLAFSEWRTYWQNMWLLHKGAPAH